MLQGPALHFLRVLATVNLQLTSGLNTYRIAGQNTFN